jgi:hypothetical protein
LLLVTIASLPDTGLLLERNVHSVQSQPDTGLLLAKFVHSVQSQPDTGLLLAKIVRHQPQGVFQEVLSLLLHMVLRLQPLLSLSSDKVSLLLAFLLL